MDYRTFKHIIKKSIFSSKSAKFQTFLSLNEIKNFYSTKKTCKRLRTVLIRNVRILCAVAVVVAIAVGYHFIFSFDIL